MLGKKGKSDGGMIVVLLLIAIAVGVMTDGFQNFGASSEDEGDEVGGEQNLGDAATHTINSFTGSWGKEGAETEVYPAYTVTKDGAKIVNDVNVNSTTDVAVGDIIDIYCTGATYYCDPVKKDRVDQTRDIVELEAYTVVATTDLVITGFDKDENSLTADDNSNNSADYAGGDVLASDNERYFFKLENTGANTNFRLGAICTWFIGDEADDFELTESGWTEVGVPDTLDSQSITHYDDVNASTSEKGFAHCYTPDNSDGFIHLKENQDTGKLKFNFDSDDTTQPTANGDTYFGMCFMDAGYSTDKNGDLQFGFFMDDDTEDPGAVGLDENAETAAGGVWGAVSLDVCAKVEPQ